MPFDCSVDHFLCIYITSLLETKNALVFYLEIRWLYITWKAVILVLWNNSNTRLTKSDSLMAVTFKPALAWCTYSVHHVVLCAALCKIHLVVTDYNCHASICLCVAALSANKSISLSCQEIDAAWTAKSRFGENCFLSSWDLKGSSCMKSSDSSLVT